MNAQTPTAAALGGRLAAILAAGNNFIDQNLQARLKALKPRDIDQLRPPSIAKAGGVWVNDTGFCRRLGALLFDVSDETIDELSISQYQIFLAAVYSNFTSYMEQTTQ